MAQDHTGELQFINYLRTYTTGKMILTVEYLSAKSTQNLTLFLVFRTTMRIPKPLFIYSTCQIHIKHSKLIHIL